MGIFENGAPFSRLLSLLTQVQAMGGEKPTVFVETGTHLGSTARTAAQYFQKVHTIEISSNFYETTKQTLSADTNIVCYLGDSAVILPKIIPALNSAAVFWLDGHYSGGNTGGAAEGCPLISEIRAIVGGGIHGSIILIDDARLMCNNPEDIYVWPSYASIVMELGEKWVVQEKNDVIWCVPKEYSKLLKDLP